MPTFDSQNIYRELDKKHPIYELWAPVWEVYRDITGESEAEKTKYLPRNKLEPKDQYEFRVAISEFIPETPRAIARINGALFKEKPKREIKAKELLAFYQDVDFEEHDMNHFMERVISQLLTYGSTRILINVKVPEELVQTQLSRYEEQQLGIRPYGIIYNPLAIIDWDYDEYNQLNSVRIKEERARKANPNDPLSKTVRIVRFIHIDRNSSTWWEFQGEQGKEELTNTPQVVEHNLGEVPMVVAYWPTKILPMVGSAYIRWMAKADIQKFRCESDQAYDIYLHAHPQLKIWTQEELANVGVGTGTYLKLHPGTTGMNREDAAYIEAPTSAFDALKNLIRDKLETIQRHANTDPLGVLEPGVRIFQASGVARAWSFGTSEARILSDIADTAVQIERKLFKLASMYAGVTEKFEIQYPEEFDLSSTATLIEETKDISQMINSPTLLRSLHKRIAASKIGDATAETAKTIQKEIDDNPLINTSVGKPIVNELAYPNELPEVEEEGEEQPESRKSIQGQRGGSFANTPMVKP